MTMPSIQGDIRDNIVAAILAIQGWPQNMPVEKVAFMTDVFYRQHRAMVGVAMTEDRWTSIDYSLSDPLDQPATIDLNVVVYATSELSPTGALETDDGNIDGIVSLILGSNRPGFTKGLRAVDVGMAFTTGGVYCRAVKTFLVADQRRSEGSGGAMAKVILMRTTTLPL